MQAAHPLTEITPRQALDLLSRSMGLGADVLAQALQTNRRTVQRWRNGESYPQQAARARLAELVNVSKHLQVTFRTDESSRRWLAHPSRYLAGLTPIEAIKAGRPDRVDAALEVLDLGMFV